MLKQFVPLLAFLFSQTVYSFHLSSARGDDPIISGNTDFAFALNTQLTKTAGEKNVFFSPLSVSFALTMTMNGSSGETRKAMMEALSYSGISIDTVNSALSKMIESLNKKNKSFEVSIANSLWLLKKYAFKKEFISLCKDKYQAEAREVEFSPNDIDAINDWVKEKTRNKIPKLIDQTEAGSVLMLLNAIYFNGTWAEQFDKDDTRNDTFYVSKEKRVLVPMMSLIERMPYYENKDFQAITLPYKDSNYGMTIFLPTERNSLDKFHQTLKSKNWKEWRSKFKSKKGTLELPRFKYEYEASLIGALKQLGMGIAFDEKRADFSEMAHLTTDRLFISAVQHKAIVEVNERGTEAAAVTRVGMVATAAPERPEEKFLMIVNRPFFFVINDMRDGSILFMGSVRKPE